MQVELFHQILIWPLKIEGSGMESAGWMDDLQEIFQQGSPWQPVADSYESGIGPEPTRYAEFVYFHPFVQEFLFSQEAAKALRMMQRTDVAKVRVRLAKSEHLLDVLRLRLYLVRTGIILLVVEVRGENIDLIEAEDLADAIRRVYPPFWEQDQPAGHCPVEMTWLGSEGQALAKSNYGDQGLHLAFVRTRRHPPVSSHWRWLLEPMNKPESKWGYRHIEDERIPAMCYFAFADPTELKDGDFFRLGMLDSWGKSSTLPYATSLFKEFEKNCCYDRFWDQPSLPGHEWMTTRYICTDFSFVMIGKLDPGFYSNAETGGLAHFRHHYFQLGLVGQLQKASLLVFAGKLARSVTSFSEAGHRAKLYREVERLVLDIADFTARFWFTELSNQLQGRELFNLWSEQMGLRKLFERVMAETGFVQQSLADYQRDRQTDVTLNLTRVGVYGVTLSLLLTVGISIAPYAALYVKAHCDWPGWWGGVGSVSALLFLGLAIGFGLDKFMQRRMKS